MGLPIDIIIRVDAKKENDSGEYTFQCKALGELVRCGECKYCKIKHQWNAEPYNECELTRRCAEDDWFCADGERKEQGDADS